MTAEIAVAGRCFETSSLWVIIVEAAALPYRTHATVHGHSQTKQQAFLLLIGDVFCVCVSAAAVDKWASLVSLHRADERHYSLCGSMSFLYSYAGALLICIHTRLLRL